MPTKYIHYSVAEPVKSDIKKSLEERGHFKITTDTTGLNIALEEAYLKTTPKYLSLNKLLDKNALDEVNITSFRGDLVRESLAMVGVKEFHSLPRAQVEGMIQEFCVGGKDNFHKYLLAVDKVLWFSKPEDFWDIFTCKLLPHLRAVFPDLSVYGVSMDPLLAQREAGIRCLFTESKIPQIINPADFPGCLTLRHLHVQSFTGFDSYLRFALNLFSPFIYGHVSARYYTGMVILFGEPFDARSVYPGMLMDSFSPKSTFMMEYRDAADNDERFVLDKSLYGDNYEAFLRWYIDKINEFLFYLSDPTHFPDTQQITELSPERWLMTSLTIVRMLHEAQTIQTNINRNEFLRKILAFASLDKISTLCALKCKHRFSDVDMFKYLLSKNRSAKALKKIFDAIPYPYNTALKSKVDEAHAGIEETILKGVFVNGFHQGDRIKGVIGGQLYDKTTDEYIGNYLRTLRNTHHGYLSDKKQYFCPPEFAINAGNLSDLFPDMLTLWLLALILTPKRFI